MENKEKELQSRASVHISDLEGVSRKITDLSDNLKEFANILYPPVEGEDEIKEEGQEKSFDGNLEQLIRIINKKIEYLDTIAEQLRKFT